MNGDPVNLIYGLVDPRTLLIRYVGLSSSGMRRPKDHRRASTGSTRCRQWVKALQRNGLDYTIVVLEIVQDEEGLAPAERWWIAYGKASGWPLTNLTSGGGLSEEAIAKKRIAKLRQFVRKAEHAETRRAELQEMLDNGRCFVADPFRSEGEITSACFQLFERHAASFRVIIEVVIGARVTSEQARSLYKKWLQCFRPEDLKLDNLKMFRARPRTQTSLHPSGPCSCLDNHPPQARGYSVTRI